MKEWLTAREIAAEKLPFMPETESAILRLAAREDWDDHPFARKRQGRGGGMEYRYLILPALAQAAYIQRYAVIGAKRPVESAEDASTSNLSERGRLERDARLAVLAAFEDWLKGQQARGRTFGHGLGLFVRHYNHRTLQIEAWVREAVPSISTRTMMRWRSAIKGGKKDALAVDRSECRKGKGILATANNGEVEAYITAWIAKNPALSAEDIRGYCEDHFGSEIVDRHGEVKALPPLRTFQHFIADLKARKKVVLTKITDPDTFRSTMKLSGTGAYRHVTEPNALWMIDASPVDALCKDGRHSLYACIDLATRRLVITLSKTPRASAVMLMIRKAIMAWGAPAMIKTDNGSDFVAMSIKRLFLDLGITPDVSDAYSPEQKGHVERVIKTFQHQVAPQLPGYIGHSVAERKAIEGRKSFAQRLGADEAELFEVELTAAELQVKIDDWLAYVYHEREHGGLKDRTPNEVAAASSAPIRRVDERALDILLMPLAGKKGFRKVGKQGIKDNGFNYLAGSIMVGTDVFCRRDPLDMGRLFVFDAEDGRFLDEAICPELANVNPIEFVKAQKEIAAEVLRNEERRIKADIRELKKGPSGIDRTIRLAKRKKEERDAATANVIPLPKREEVHETPAIRAALDVTAERKAPEVSDRQRWIAAEIAADLDPIQKAVAAEQGNVTRLRKDSTREQRFAAALDIDARFKLNEDLVTKAELAWLASYREAPEYKARKAIHDDFGDQAPVPLS